MTTMAAVKTRTGRFHLAQIETRGGSLEPAHTPGKKRPQKPDEESGWLQVQWSAKGSECKPAEQPVQTARATGLWPFPPATGWVDRSSEQPGNGKLQPPATGPTTRTAP